MRPEMIKIEIERVVNLIAGFGWVKREERIEAGKVTLVLQKTLEITQEGD